MDNVFVFAVIFNYYRVPLRYQYRVLFWGILGAILMRLTFVLLGTALIQQFEGVMPLFGLFLIYTAVKLVWQEDAQVDPERNLLRRLASRVFYVADGDHGERFFVKQAGHWAVTPLFLVLLVIESTDVAFAVDSVPAILGITEDRFIVFTSNIFAILGLRALYFLLAGVMDMFHYLKYGLAAVLGFIGVKMIAEYCDKKFWGGGGHLIPPSSHWQLSWECWPSRSSPRFCRSAASRSGRIRRPPSDFSRSGALREIAPRDEHPPSNRVRS